MRTREVLLPQIERLKRAFLKAEHGGVSKRNQDGIRDYNKGKELQSQPTEDYQDVVGTSVQESFADEEDFIADFDVVSGAEQIALTEEMTQLLSIIGIEGAEHLLRRQQQNGATVSAQQLSHLKESISRDDHDTQLQQVTEIVPVEPAKLFTTSIVSKAETVHGSQGETVDGSQDESDSTDDVRVPCTSNNNERLEILDAPEMSVTRIIIGNLDIFIDRHPYFMDKIGGWIKVRQSSYVLPLIYSTYLDNFANTPLIVS